METLIQQAIVAGQWHDGRKTHSRNRYTIIGDKVVVTLTKGQYCVIDLIDIDLLDGCVWCYSESYALNSGTRMHKLIMNRMDNNIVGMVHHLDGNHLNNSRINLTRVSHTAVHYNRRRPSSNTSGITGVSYMRGSGLWNAYIRRDGVTSRKLFESKDDAILWRMEREMLL